MNGDWVAHYAVRFAAHDAARALRLVHVHEGSPEPHLSERVARIADECAVIGVRLDSDLVARGHGTVAERLLDVLSPGDTLIAGTRARARNFAFLAGTVSERLLEAGRFPVIVLRVVHPGALGQPGRVLLPLAGRPHAPTHVLRLLGDDLHQLHVLHVREVSRLRFGILSHDTAEEMRAPGRTYLAQIEAELVAALAPHRFELDASVVVSDDPPKEILLHAARHRSRLICLGASERSLAQRLVHGSPIERVLRATPADVAIYRGPA